MATNQESNCLPKGYWLQEYCVESVLGAGGFGITYKAHDTHLDTLVAIKEFFPVEWAYRSSDQVNVLANAQGQVIVPEVQVSGYEWGLNRFLEEARVLARVDHPYIVRIKRYFRANGTAYIVMDYEEGEPLSTLLRREQTLSEPDLRGLLEEVIPALEAVHQQGYLHRDLKPSNLYIRARDGCVMLIDFGAARQSLSQSSKSITGLVTPGYSPPEQYITRSERYGPWTDLYALGAVLYRCITGAPPPEAPDRQMWDALVPAVEAGQGRYHRGLLEAVDKALIVRPEDRFQSVAEMRSALEAAGCLSREMATHTPNRIGSHSDSPPSQLVPGRVSAPHLPTSRRSDDLDLPEIFDSGQVLPSSFTAAGPAPDLDMQLVLEEMETADSQDGAAAADSVPDDRPAAAAVTTRLSAVAGETVAVTPSRLPTPRRPAPLPEPGAICLSAMPPAALPGIPGDMPEIAVSKPVRKLAGTRRDWILVLILVSLLTVLSALVLKIYGDYQERSQTLQQEVRVQESENARQAAQEKEKRTQEEAQRQKIAHYLKQSYAAILAKDWTRATEFIEQAERLQPNNPRVAILRSELMDAQQSMTLAVETWVEPRIDMPLIRIKEGCFMMGSATGQGENYPNEVQHQTCVNSFWIGQYEITNAQYRLFKPDHDSGVYLDQSLGESHQPVVEVSWNEAAAFAEWLSRQTGRRYRLPTEAEWEYAARAGTKSARFWGNEPANACSYANVADKSAQRSWGANSVHDCDDGRAVAATVGGYAPNAFKIHDILGNAAEWTCSEYKRDYQEQETRCSNAGPKAGHRTVRGGSWDDGPRLVRVSDRDGRDPTERDNDLGFRLVLEE